MSRPDDQPRAEIALSALAEVRALLDDWEGTDWSHTNPVRDIDHILTMAYARIRMAGQRRDRRSARWLAKAASGVWPRMVRDRSGKGGVVAVCFNVEITDGSKVSTGRRVEVRLSAGDACLLGDQMARMGAMNKSLPQMESVPEGELLHGGSVTEGNET